MSVAATAGGLPTRLGKYEILTPIASGGMARIYIGRSTGIGSFERHVVLKMILPERAQDETAVQMFLDEARLAASLNHQNVAQVFEVGQDVGIHFLAMEYVHGQDLRALLAKAGSSGTRVPLELALTVVAGAAAGLNHAHERRTSDGVPMGIVHRDVSPSNIMIGYDGAVKLLDFGIAKATLRSIETQSGIIKGKFAYMAPEQCRGREVDRRSDVFSLGIILYEVTTQHRCFRADSDFDTMHRIVTGDIVRPTRLVQGYPQALEAIVMKALAVDPGQRYQTAGLLLEAVESFALASRMSLSTMSLGRFMRDLFGEMPEPWLVVGRVGAPVSAKEQTISNTNASSDHGGRPLPPMDEAPLHLPPEAPLLDLARGGGDLAPPAYPAYAPPMLPPDPPPVELAPGSPYPVVARPGLAGGSQPLPPFGPQPSVGSGPAHPAPVLPPFGAPGGPFGVLSPFGPQPSSGSGSGPAHSAMPSASQSMRGQHGYSPPTLQQHNRLLYIGLGVLLVGIIVLLAIVILDGSDDLPAPPPRQSATQPGSAAPAAAAPPAATKPAETRTTTPTPPPTTPEAAHAAAPDPSPAVSTSIQVHILSMPPGAQVLLAGKVVGTTPLTVLVARAKGMAPLVVRHAGYADNTMSVDLGGDIERQVKLTALPDDAATRSAPSRETPAPASTAPQKPTSHDPAPTTRERPRPAQRESKHCQPVDQINPFDTSCDGGPCPPCASSAKPPR